MRRKTAVETWHEARDVDTTIAVEISMRFNASHSHDRERVYIGYYESLHTILFYSCVCVCVYRHFFAGLRWNLRTCSNVSANNLSFLGMFFTSDRYVMFLPNTQQLSSLTRCIIHRGSIFYRMCAAAAMRCAAGPISVLRSAWDLDLFVLGYYNYSRDETHHSV